MRSAARRSLAVWSLLGTLMSCTDGDDRTIAGPIELPECQDGQVHDGTSCVPSACGESTWGSEALDDGTIYVDASAPGEGDGSPEAPFTSIQEGADAAGAAGAGLVVVASGTYVENLVLDESHDGVHIAGRCPDLVVVDGSDGSDDEPVVRVEPSGADDVIELSGLSLLNGPGGGLRHLGGQLRGHEMSLRDNSSIGLSMEGSDIVAELSDIDVLDTVAGDRSEGLGLYVAGSVEAVLDGCHLDRNRAVGVALEKGRGPDALPSLTLRNCTVNDTRTDRTTTGFGIAVYDGTLVAEGLEVRRSTSTGIVLSGSTVEAELTDVVVADTFTDELFGQGRGIGVQYGAEATIRDSRVDDCAEIGIFIADTGTQVRVIGTVVSNTVASPVASSQFGAMGMLVSYGAEAVVLDSTIEGTEGVNLAVSEPGTAAIVRDSTLRDSVKLDDHSWSTAVVVVSGGVLRLESSLVDGNDSGLFLSGLFTELEVVDSVVSNNGGGYDSWMGRAVEVSDGAWFLASGTTFSNHRSGGILVSGWQYSLRPEGAWAELDDCVIEDNVRGNVQSVAHGAVAQVWGQLLLRDTIIRRTEGPGLYANFGGELTCERCTVEDSWFAGAMASWATIELVDSTIGRSEPEPSYGGGVGIYADGESDEDIYALWGMPGPELIVESTVVEEQPLAAVWLQGPGSYSFVDSELQGGAGEVFAEPGQVWHGNSLYAASGVVAAAGPGAPGLYLEGNSFVDARQALFLDGTSATLVNNTWSGNEVDVVQQRCDDLAALGAEPMAEEELGGLVLRQCEALEPVETLEYLGMYGDLPVPEE